MHNTRPAKITSPIVSLDGGYVKAVPLALIIGAIGIGAALVLSLGDLRRFYHAYHTAYCFMLSIGLGCLFFVTIMHLTRAGWSVTVRRIAEIYAMCLLPMFLLWLPILVTLFTPSGGDLLFSWIEPGWSHGEHGAGAIEPGNLPPLEELKKAFLNSSFFAIRFVVYFLIWGFMGYFFLSNSLKQDQTGDKSLTSRMQAFAAPMMILFAASIVFSSFDLEMSLSPLWFSTMYPVYFFAGAFLGALCTILLTCMYLQRTGRITDEITIEHYHDLGKLMQGFVIFWGYIAFSQFLLIWYANIPEETFWYDLRFQDNGWRTASIVLLVGHLFIPFFLLMGRWIRRNKTILTISAIFILCLHYLDHYWQVMPQYEAGVFPFSGMGIIIDLGCVVGMVALFVALFCLIARDKPLVPTQDPRLGEALNHEVH